MEKRNKKKLFAIIGGSVLAFVLTIALSVSITLAYFGDTASGDKTITLGAAVELDSSTVTTSEATVIPTQKYVVTATAAGPASTTDSVLFAVVTVETAGTDIKNAPTVDAAWTQIGTVGTTGTVYYLGTDGTVTQLGAEAVSKTLTYTDTVKGAEITNTDAGATLKITVQFVRAQVIYQADGTTLETSAANYVDVIENLGSITIA